MIVISALSKQTGRSQELCSQQSGSVRNPVSIKTVESSKEDTQCRPLTSVRAGMYRRMWGHTHTHKPSVITAIDTQI